MAIIISNSFITKLQMISDGSFNIIEDFNGTVGFISASAVGEVGGIVLSDLVLYFDPSNSSSYPGSGTTITDLSDSGLSGTMSNITYTSPYFTYNGSNSQVSIADNSAPPVSNSGTTCSIVGADRATIRCHPFSEPLI